MGRYICIYMYLSEGGGLGSYQKKLGCVIIMLGLVWLFKREFKG